MPPFTSTFSIDETINNNKTVSNHHGKEALKNQQVHLLGEKPHQRLRVYHGVIGQPAYHDQAGPEEEVFTISLETPPKDPELDRSCDWPLLGSSQADQDSTIDRSFHLQDCVSLTKDDSADPMTESMTPKHQRSKVSERDSRVRAPRRENNRGRAESLTRYVHKYECEDFMEYSVDIHDWKMSLEDDYLAPDWENLQQELTPYMRFSLLDWLVSVARTFEFSLETWCLAVSYLDRFLGSQPIGKDCLQLVGLTALWISAKQEELVPPNLEQLVALCADTYSHINFKHMELIMLFKLQFRLLAPTPSFHLNHLLAIQEERDWSDDLARHMVEIILSDHVLAREKPSRIAFAVYEAIKSFDRSAVHILESSCPKCEPHNADMWSEELFQMCLQRVLDVMAT